MLRVHDSLQGNPENMAMRKPFRKLLLRQGLVKSHRCIVEALRLSMFVHWGTILRLSSKILGLWNAGRYRVRVDLCL